MNRIQLIFNEKWAMAREDYYNLVSLILPSIHSGNFKEVEAFLKRYRDRIRIGSEFCGAMEFGRQRSSFRFGCRYCAGRDALFLGDVPPSGIYCTGGS